MSEYKCEKHCLDIPCLNCIKAIISKEKKLLEFVTKLSNLSDISTRTAFHIKANAESLLKEMGEL